jgi:hypothetical protein
MAQTAWSRGLKRAGFLSLYGQLKPVELDWNFLADRSLPEWSCSSEIGLSDRRRRLSDERPGGAMLVDEENRPGRLWRFGPESEELPDSPCTRLRWSVQFQRRGTPFSGKAR